MKRFLSERGQVLVLTVVLMLAFLGMAAIAIDVGSWFHSRTENQNTADAAARAAALQLPNTGAAAATANSYAKNGVSVAVGGDFTNPQNGRPNSMVLVTTSNVAPLYFSKLFGVNSFNIQSAAQAVFDTPTAIGPDNNDPATPIALNNDPVEACASGGSCSYTFKFSQKADDGKTGTPTYAVLDLSNTSDKKNPDASTVGPWIKNGYTDWIGAGPGFGYPCQTNYPKQCAGFTSVDKSWVGELTPYIYDMVVSGKPIYVPIFAGKFAKSTNGVICGVKDSKGGVSKAKDCDILGIDGFALFKITGCSTVNKAKKGGNTDCSSTGQDLNQITGTILLSDPTQSIVKPPPTAFNGSNGFSSADQTYYGVKVIELTK